MIVRAVVEGDTDFAVGSEDSLCGDRTLHEDVVRIVGHLLESEGNKEVSNTDTTDPRNLVDGDVCVFHIRRNPSPHRESPRVAGLQGHLQAEIEYSVSRSVCGQSEAPIGKIVLGQIGRNVRVGIRPVDVLQLDVSTELNSPLICRKIDPVLRFGCFGFFLRLLVSSLFRVVVCSFLLRFFKDI